MKTLTPLLKPIILFVFTIFLSTQLSAQKRIDVVQLKNGNVLKGTIVRQVPGKFLELKTLDKNFWKFDMEDVAEIRYERKRLAKFKQDSLPLKNSKVFIHAKFGVLLGSNGNDNEAPFSVLCSANYRFKNGLSLGGGAGLETFEETQIPVFADIRYHHKIGGFNTYLFCQSGYSFALDDRDNTNYYYYGDEMENEGGWLINPGIGVVFSGRGNTRLSLGIGYRYQKNKLSWHNDYTSDKEILREEFNRMSIHLGIIF
ncbi:hypothetical protein [Marinifilum caeruleilacunae]|uniref:Outer membrane protein beta-barrel domain-containing protein n=1 Tax=Marinifilum caeruleilacunae TaxID=2499076 RepID=A0ABX1WYE1_9BACT|nr:hypothetical protein [Marinifilum caeruleilacunae]NOU61170.1 hypothetical protein [Marinifilum caeruleilacunae]